MTATVFRTYFITGRGDEVFVNTWNLLDMTALGRQEEWEDSPEGYPQSPPYEWWIWHDSYAQHAPSRWFGEPDPNDPNDQRPPRKDASGYYGPSDEPARRPPTFALHWAGADTCARIPGARLRDRPSLSTGIDCNTDSAP